MSSSSLIHYLRKSLYTADAMVKLNAPASVVVAATVVNAASLGSYNVDPKSVSTSGLSAGGFFAAQLGVAHSNIYQTGFGVFAGGPFDCARAQSVSNNTVPHAS